MNTISPAHASGPNATGNIQRSTNAASSIPSAASIRRPGDMRPASPDTDCRAYCHSIRGKLRLGGEPGIGASASAFLSISSISR